MTEERFIDIKRLVKSKSPKIAKWIPGFVFNYLKRILHQDEINAFLRENKTLKNADFCKAVIEYFQINIEIIGKENIPTTGPIVITMNHPLGGMDAIALIAELQNHRTDLKFVVNDLLMNLTQMQDLFVGVNKHGKNEGSTRQQITDLFDSEKAVCIFPAGLVSRKIDDEIIDLDWKKTFITYADKNGQALIPIHISGGLSNFFYRLSRFRKAIGIKMNIEMLYLSDEMFKQKGKTIQFTVGKPFYTKDLPAVSEREKAQIVKRMVYDLKNQVK
jgi:putative hemolysin